MSLDILCVWSIMKLTSTSFDNNSPIPERCAFAIKDPEEHIALGENRNPQLSWSGIPARAFR